MASRGRAQQARGDAPPPEHDVSMEDADDKALATPVPAIPSALRYTVRRTGKRNTDGRAREAPGKPGQANKPWSYCKIYETEAMTAAYCGFRDTAKFREFVLSPYVLQPFNSYFHLKGLAQQRKALELLQEIGIDDDAWSSEEDPSTVYPTTTKTQAHFQLALIAAQMLRAISKVRYTEEETLAEEETFMSLVSVDLPALSQFSKSDLPDLGPFDGETPQEPHNRCINILRYLAHVTAPSIWKKRFETPNWNQSRLITREYFPKWMLEDEQSLADDVELPDQNKDAAHEYLGEPINLQVFWNFNAKAPGAKEYREWVNEESIDLPPFEQTIAIDPRIWNGSQFRDLIRRVFSIDKIGAQLLYFRLTIDQGEETERSFNLMTGSWPDIRPVLTPTIMATSKVLATFITRVREPHEVCWEWDAVCPWNAIA